MRLFTLLLGLMPSFAFAQTAQINCAPLDPRVSISKSKEVKLQASARTVFKIAQAGGEVERKAKEEMQNLSTTITGNDQLQARWIYLFCEMLRTSKNMTEPDKKEAFNAVIRATNQIPVTTPPSSSKASQAPPKKEPLQKTHTQPSSPSKSRSGAEEGTRIEQRTEGPNSPAVGGVTGNVDITIGNPEQPESKK